MGQLSPHTTPCSPLSHCAPQGFPPSQPPELGHSLFSSEVGWGKSTGYRGAHLGPGQTNWPLGCLGAGPDPGSLCRTWVLQWALQPRVGLLVLPLLPLLHLSSQPYTAPNPTCSPAASLRTCLCSPPTPRAPDWSPWGICHSSSSSNCSSDDKQPSAPSRAPPSPVVIQTSQMTCQKSKLRWV